MISLPVSRRIELSGKTELDIVCRECDQHGKRYNEQEGAEDRAQGNTTGDWRILGS